MKFDRRTVLIGGGAGIGLVVAFAVWPHHLSSDLESEPGEETFGNFIRIAKSGQVTVASPQTETGQGIWTGLSQIVADELGAAWDSIAVEPAPLTSAYANPLAPEEGWLDGFGWLRAHRIENDAQMRITAGSTSVRAFERPLRGAGAIARSMLVGAAADRWGVNPDECETGDGFVLNRGRTFTFGELAEEAADRTPPSRTSLRQSTKGRLIGHALPRLDGPAKANGHWRFAGDVRLPGMLFASVRGAPPGGSLKGFSRDSIAAVPGVRHVTTRADWMAVVADSWAAAERAMKAADPLFSGDRSATEMRPLFEEALAHGLNRRRFRRGDYESTVHGFRPLAATYFVAPNQHLSLEPLTATAQMKNGRLELWAATQAPGAARAQAATAAHLSESDVTLYPMPAGAPSGRALEADAIRYAVALALELKVPVQTTLSQSASQNDDLLAPGALARITALPAESGLLAAWKMELASSSGMDVALDRMFDVENKRALIRTTVTAAPPYDIANVAVEAVNPSLPYKIGYIRGSPHREIAFFTEGFVDELARATATEPLAFRMSMLGTNGRLARCLQGAARLAGWDGGGAGSKMGIAGCSAYGSHIGLVATATVGSDHRIKVERLVAAVDCGGVVNSGLIQQQIEAGLIWAMAQAIVPSPEFVAGMPRARPIGGIGLPLLKDSPQIIVEVIPSSDPSGGVSGLGTTVLAPALANALYAATGKRLRSLPLDPMEAA